ncbi:hypoxanthine phosphoribosyltransferase [Prevotella disiens JCM 6334 = ATCC 29426]|jgi:hypoxanthine phosphoribosyltransferase|uniref:Hypoxanthine phosphoribosyltransferase n=2 Tax=Prevotella disiens TaxID=28130 RepID=A0A379DY03_9BACT|nr:hypoxanthine phosphoribosyltransferase [Prevotella disiens]ERJ80667.1 hypoxanthine phosphoribosyltransferase [Prevotella disiens JCM 6334 = ATCC 29426]SUB84892.1 Hypoxanthine phosphoribosyltransferase [Prevotella disiens]
MSRITIKDLTFETSIPEATILERVERVAEKLNKDMADKTPLFLAVLNGSFMYASDLMKFINIPCEISFVKVASYAGTESSGKVTEVIGLNEDITGREIVIVEDIVDTGHTMERMLEILKKKNPANIHISTLLLKPGKLQVPLDIEYAAMEIPNDFIVGYGLDYDQQGRNLRDIYTLVQE